MCLKEIYCKICIHKHLCDAYPSENERRRCFYHVALGGLGKLGGIWIERKVQENQERLELSGTQFLVYADEANLVGKNLYTIEKIKVALVHVSKEGHLK
jgi:hypothetical protein